MSSLNYSKWQLKKDKNCVIQVRETLKEYVEWRYSEECKGEYAPMVTGTFRSQYPKRMLFESWTRIYHEEQKDEEYEALLI